MRVLSTKGGSYVCISLLQDFVLEAMIRFFSKGEMNKAFTDNIADFRIQKIEKISYQTENQQHFVPFYITIKKT